MVLVANPAHAVREAEVPADAAQAVVATAIRPGSSRTTGRTILLNFVKEWSGVTNKLVTTPKLMIRQEFPSVL